MNQLKYLMESDSETVRLDLKTNEETVRQQALWAGIKPGMRVADLGFGSGKTTFALSEMVGSAGEVVAIDYAMDRIEYARKNYPNSNIQYLQKDIRQCLSDLGHFDFIYIRFVLEYYNSCSFDILKNVTRSLKPGGILQVIDLDHNCLCHFGLSCRLEKTLFDLMEILNKRLDFDPYVGRKLYAFLYDLGFENIRLDMAPHHLIYGDIDEVDVLNWDHKARIAVRQLGFHFDNYSGGYDEFYAEFMTFLRDPRRLTYTPMFSCRGRKPAP